MGVMSGPYVIRGSVSLPEAELMWRFSRSSGPGGQHVNTSDSQVELRFDLAATEALPEVWKERALERLAEPAGGRRGHACGRRSTAPSGATARPPLVRLASLLAEATAPPPKPRRKTRIPRGINERRLREKKQRGDTKRGRSGRDWGDDPASSAGASAQLPVAPLEVRQRPAVRARQCRASAPGRSPACGRPPAPAAPCGTPGSRGPRRPAVRPTPLPVRTGCPRTAAGR